MSISFDKELITESEIQSIIDRMTRKRTKHRSILGDNKLAVLCKKSSLPDGAMIFPQNEICAPFVFEFLEYIKLESAIMEGTQLCHIEALPNTMFYYKIDENGDTIIGPFTAGRNTIAADVRAAQKSKMVAIIAQIIEYAFSGMACRLSTNGPISVINFFNHDLQIVTNYNKNTFSVGILGQNFEIGNLPIDGPDVDMYIRNAIKDYIDFIYNIPRQYTMKGLDTRWNGAISHEDSRREI